MFWVDLHQPGTKDTKGLVSPPWHFGHLWKRLETSEQKSSSLSPEVWGEKQAGGKPGTGTPSHPIHPIRLSLKIISPHFISSFLPIFPHKAIPIIPIPVIRGRGFLNCSWASSCRPRNIEIRPLASQRLSLGAEAKLKNGEISWEYITQHIFGF